MALKINKEVQNLLKPGMSLGYKVETGRMQAVADWITEVYMCHYLIRTFLAWIYRYHESKQTEDFEETTGMTLEEINASIERFRTEIAAEEDKLKKLLTKLPNFSKYETAYEFYGDIAKNDRDIKIQKQRYDAIVEHSRKGIQDETARIKMLKKIHEIAGIKAEKK